ncbi:MULTISPECIES: TlpA disulfide reductase family protein [Micromonospora]|uniref:TlpA family protein disulfide reductase n=1 Tax=Micromonospora solifontis TaxID=2487138 RepID=A0ABX9WD04_9ACTN|nr:MULTISPECIES: TlpA disulfide reductase family protein [Micromonospora]NES15809.1 TlpA family protein disulfide reductase [Micromonospora sp. PPF5-17B]NES38076.1 TlpA family protein disulfide reductase [Micromonospora solifontis]NES56655.1 TlpA family protein disulfide reductase [Micromonospora sp. PPF5-6]RNL97081.1 TlpA family protein disulfide reductase [Micromonospora solifontis]
MLTRRLVAALLTAVTAGTALAGCTSGSQESRCSDKNGIIQCAPDQRSKAPALAGDLLTGGRYDVAQDRGKVVVVNFWGSWCAPCRAEADDLEATYQATKASGVTFLGINVQDSKDKALAFEEGRITYPSLFDPASRLALALDIPPNTIPATVVLDREGRTATVIRAAVTREELRPIVEKIAAEEPASR